MIKKSDNNLEPITIVQIYLRERDLPYKSMIGVTIGIEEALDAVRSIRFENPYLADILTRRLSQ